ncbi:putative non-transporter ABC protein [Heterostelium album PN500]|uniref:Putative non-transporter ABC protein n=1 Tax=Heterostelium pallidum (strain ATCC 26659 / Pp 5 / PN500) TaxID=670386 RepID=D3BRS1_HETP5|nr:putative non-transporter ABC protein [Heterostelium album PN500]EFA76103.1 putative non-transporter ABC protein [Heterostelium album PN500]|eukprot:XP_020428237.1 putative non-transporter ABC protein [Heterostelium album PN500]
MSTNGQYSHSIVVKYVLLTIYYAVLDNLNTHLIKLVSVENQLLIRRMVMEKLLYSEIGAFDFLRKKNNIGPLELEFKISSSINTTISFFTYTIPDFFATLYAFVVEGSDLFRSRRKIDPLIILHPILIAIYQKVSQRLRVHLVEANEIKFRDTYQVAMSKMVTNTLEGLSDIQVNNLQETQLSLFDNLIEKELENTQSFSTLVSRVWRSIHNRSVFEFAAEVWVAHKVMLRQGINNEEYRTMLLEINRVIRLGKRIWNSFASFKNIYKHQKKVKELLNIPTFIEEDGNLKSVYKFEELKLRNVKYAYENKFSLLPPLPVLDLQGEMTILPGKRYALVGQNRAGKSTLNHILCKIYTPDDGEILLNGIPYNEISRSSIRRLISYVSQRPFIFHGTVRDNIRVGNPTATEEQTASAAGVFAFAEDANSQLPDSPYYGNDDEMKPFGDPISPAIKSTLTKSGCIDNNTCEAILNQSQQQVTLRRTVNFQNTPESLVQGRDVKSNIDACLKGEDLESSKLVQRVWSVLNLASMDDDEESDDESNVNPAPIVPQSMDITNNPVLDQTVELGGKNISGGFAQSIALARIFVRTEAKIVILDESMSQMDAFKKREIIFPKLFQFATANNITLIIVSHDLISMQNMVDHIFVLDHGKIVHQGSHKELVKEKAPVYMKLLGSPL